MSKKRSSSKDEKTQADYAREALESRNEAETPPRPDSKTAHEGQLHEHERREHKEPPMGALDAEGHRPVLERSRKVR